MSFRLNHPAGSIWNINHDIGIGQHHGTSSVEFPYYYELFSPNSESNAANTYYPCSFYTGGFRSPSSGANLIIARSYGDTGPAQRGGSSIGWNDSSTHQGGLYASWRIGDSAWSDMYEAQLVRSKRTYHVTISDFGMLLANNNGSGPFWVRLRGGFRYHVYAKMPVNPSWVTPGGGALNHNNDPNYQVWPQTTTSVNDSRFSDNKTDMV